MKSKCLLLFLSLVFSPLAYGLDEGDFRLGVSAGNVTLTGDAGTEFGNALGYGIHAGYAATDVMFFDLTYNQSRHNDLDRSTVDIGVNYYTGSYDALLWNLSAGGSFINHKFELIDLSDATYTSDAFALYFGGGGDFAVGDNFMTGLQLRYYKAFATRVTVNGEDFNAIQDSLSVVLRLFYTF